jgi:hypothetical protein
MSFVHSVQADLLSISLANSHILLSFNSLQPLTNILFHSFTSTLIRSTLSLEYQLSKSSLSATFNSYFLLLSSSAAFLAFSHFSISFIFNSLALCSGDNFDNLSHSALAASFSDLYREAASLSLIRRSLSPSQRLNLGVTLAVCSHISSGLRYFSICIFSSSIISVPSHSPLKCFSYSLFLLYNSSTHILSSTHSLPFTHSLTAFLAAKKLFHTSFSGVLSGLVHLLSLIILIFSADDVGVSQAKAISHLSVIHQKDLANFHIHRLASFHKPSIHHFSTILVSADLAYSGTSDNSHS